MSNQSDELRMEMELKERLDNAMSKLGINSYMLWEQLGECDDGGMYYWSAMANKAEVMVFEKELAEAKLKRKYAKVLSHIREKLPSTNLEENLTKAEEIFDNEMKKIHMKYDPFADWDSAIGVY